MAGPEIETPCRTEARLQAVLRSAEVGILGEAYGWDAVASERFPGGISKKAVALVNDGNGWSQLVPVPRSFGQERWALIRIRFDNGSNTDGFTDWLASYLRRRLTARVMIVTGLGHRSGHYLYWGVPEPLRQEAVREIAILSTRPATGVRGVGLL